MRRCRFLIVLLVLGAGPPLLAQDNAPAVANLSLDELNRLRVTIASLADKPIREQPGIVTVLTDKDIAETGAQDLADVLALVPGFNFAADVDGVVGADFRGLWAYEGKILVLFDGIPVNEGLYGTVPINGHYSAAQIKRVEIIRGPGSARYGGNAELAVISVTTKGAEQNGGFVSVRPEIAGGQVGTNVEGSVGYTLANGWRWAIGARYEDFNWSDQTYVSLDGQHVDLTTRSSITPAMVTGNVGWKALDIRVIADNFQFDNPTGFGNPSLQTTLWTETFRSLMGSAKYDVKPAAWLTISPKVTLTRQHPWWLHTSVGQGDFELQYDKRALDVPATIAIDPRQRLLVGLTAESEEAIALQTSPFFGQAPPSVFFSGADRVHYHEVSGYAQYDIDTTWANVSIGGRYETHSYAGSAFVPRIGITRAWDKLHVKALFDQAFRTPNVETMQQRLLDTSVTYEKSTDYQMEVGYQFSAHVSAVANLYKMRVENPLAFTVESNTMFGYVNGTPISTHGSEMELRYANDSLAGYLSYSHYDADEQLSQSLGLYGSSVPGLNLALPAHNVSFSATYHFGKPLSWNVNGSHISGRRAFAYPGAEALLPPEWNVNTQVAYRRGPATLAIGVRNLFNEEAVVGQAYAGGAAPLPLLRRSFAITLGYHF